jgi:hypothetical protein
LDGLKSTMDRKLLYFCEPGGEVPRYQITIWFSA